MITGSQDYHRDFIFTRAFVLGSLLLVLVLMLILTWTHPAYVVGLVPLGLFTSGIYLLFTGLKARQKPVKWLLSIAVLNMLVVIPELTLRVDGFYHRSGIQFGFPRKEDMTSQFFTPDEALFWHYDPALPGVNSLGFHDEETVIPKPANVFRILILSDSVAAGYEYPHIMEELLNVHLANEPRATPLRVESVSLAVPGYTSYQGRVAADLYGLAAEPDVVLVMFGWNDHWQAYGEVDSQKTITVSGSWFARDSGYLYNRIRLIQAMTYLGEKLAGSSEFPLGVPRVSLDEYQANLQYIGQFFNAEAIPVVFITAPTTYYRFGVPDYVIKRRFVTDAQTAIDLHRRYNDIVRNLPQSELTYVFDLQQIVDDLSDDMLTAIFVSDGIHFTEYGAIQAALYIDSYLQANGLLPFLE